MNADYNAMIDTLEKALSDNPESMRFARLADMYLHVGKIDDAVELCTRGLQKYPRYITGRFILAKGLMAQGNNEDARREFETVLEMNNRYVLAWKYYGDLLRNMGQHDASDLSYSELLEIDPLDEDSRAMVEALKQKRAVEKDSDILSISHHTPELLEAEDIQQENGEKTSNGEDKFSYILDDIFSEEEESENVDIDMEDETSPEIADIAGVRLPERKESPHKDIPVPSPESEREKIEPVPESEPESTRTVLEPEAEKTEASLEPKEEQIEDLISDALPEDAEKPADASSAANESPTIHQHEHVTEGSTDQERIVTPTLGEIYAAQGQFSKAISVFEILAEKDPDNNTYQEKIAFLKQKLEDSDK